jgi:RimJ/RimL family protein N-acetyltransferase
VNTPGRVTLEGILVRLEPLGMHHLTGLWAVGKDQELWTWTLLWPRSEQQLSAYIAEALRQEQEGRALPFAIVERHGGRIVGSTRFGSIEPVHRRLEIGWTWVGREWQGTGVNTECKALLLTHAFEVLGCARVELKTDARNLRSRHAILSLGAQEEGTLRSHMRRWDDTLRDTVYYSILATEWPDVKARLQRRLREIRGTS